MLKSILLLISVFSISFAQANDDELDPRLLDGYNEATDSFQNDGAPLVFVDPVFTPARNIKPLDMDKLRACTEAHLEKRKASKKKTQESRKEKNTQYKSFVMADPDKIQTNPFLRTNMDAFKKALAERIARCSSESGTQPTFAGVSVSREIYCKQTSARMLELANASASMDELFKKVKDNFDFYRHEVVSKCNKGDDDKEFRFTSYYHPSLKASPVKTDKYRFPIYGKPNNLDALKKAGTNPTRTQINEGALGDSAKIYGYAENPIDLYNTQIQGSFKLNYVDPNSGKTTGKSVNMGYDGSNGHLITWFSPIMKCMGVPNKFLKNGLTVKHYFNQFPEYLDAYMSQDQHYIFFKPTPKGATGAFSNVLVGGHSIAVDPDRMPYGAIGLMNGSYPVPGSINYDSGSAMEFKDFSSFALIDDTGGSIKGDSCQLRGDYFAGDDEDSVKIANTMHRPGQVYLLLPKGTVTRAAK